MTINITELRRLAQAATSGEWYVERGNHIYGRNEVTDGEEVWHPVIACTDDDEVVVNFEANAAFIAAANPTAVSEILDRLEAAEKERDATRAMLRAALDVLEEVKGNINPERWPTTAVNGGWKLVPRPPTPTMVKAGLESSHVLNVHRVLACYDAMIDAAPEAKR